MTTILRSLRYIRISGGFPKRVALNHRRNVINSIIRCNDTAAVASITDSVDGESKFGKTKVQKPTALEHNVGSIMNKFNELGWVWHKQIVDVLSNMEHAGNLSSVQIRWLIILCGHYVLEISPSTRIELLRELWDTLNLYNIPMDVSHYNELLQGYIANNHTFTPTTILKDMESKNIKPTLRTYELLIRYHCNKGDTASATKILELMQEEGHSLTEFIFNSLILGHSEAGDLDSALKTMRIMKKNGINVTSNTYTALMCAYARVNDRSVIEEILATCKSRNLHLDDGHIWKVIYTLAASKNLQHNDKIFEYLNNSITSRSEVRSILKLMDMGYVDLALSRFLKKSQKIQSDHLYHQYVNLIMQKSLLYNVDFDKLSNICEHLIRNNSTSSPLLTVYHSYFKNNINFTLAILRSCKKANYPIKHHYFWPLLAQKGNEYDFQGILNILSIMINEFGLTPNIDTIKDYVIPHAVGNAAQLHALLKDFKLSEALLNNAYVYVILNNGMPADAVKYMQMFPGMYYYDELQYPLRMALCNRGDVETFIQITNQLYKSNTLDFELNDDPPPNSVSKISIDEVLMDFMHYCPGQKNVLLKVVEHISQLGIRITPATNAAIDECLEGFERQKITNLLNRTSTYKSTTFTQDPMKLLKSINDRKVQGLLANKSEIYLMQLLLSGTKESEATPLHPELYTFMIRSFCKDNNLESARKYMEQATRIYSNFGDSALHLEYATLLLKTEGYNVAYQYLVQHSGLVSTDETHLSSMKLLKAISQVSGTTAEHFKQMCHLLKTNGYITISNDRFNEIIKYHIRGNNLEMAVDIFCLMVAENMKPNKAKHLLCTALIEQTKEELLQKVVNVCSKYQEKEHIIADLFYSFLECGRLNQATTIFKKCTTLRSVQAWGKKIKFYRESGDATNLQRFLDATQASGINFLNLRLKVYDSLIHVYVDKNDWEKGLNTWRRMQEENLQLRKPTCDRLASLLRRNNQDVPFVYDETDTSNAEVENEENVNVVEEEKEAFQNDDLHKSER